MDSTQSSSSQADQTRSDPKPTNNELDGRISRLGTPISTLGTSLSAIPEETELVGRINEEVSIQEKRKERENIFRATTLLDLPDKLWLFKQIKQDIKLTVVRVKGKFVERNEGAEEKMVVENGSEDIPLVDTVRSEKRKMEEVYMKVRTDHRPHAPRCICGTSRCYGNPAPAYDSLI